MAGAIMTPVRVRTKELRKAKGMSQEELAERSGVPQSTISRLETGRMESVTFDQLERLADALGVDAALLIVHDKKGKR